MTSGTASAALSSNADDVSTVIYAETMMSSMGKAPVSPATEHYAVLAVTSSAGKPPKSDPLKVIYSKIDPKSQVARSENSLKQSTPAILGDLMSS